jgi:hypothetical protein
VLTQPLDNSRACAIVKAKLERWNREEAWMGAGDGGAAVPHYHGHRDRLRERFAEVGGDALPDYELLEIVLFRSIPRRDVKPIAKELIRRFGSFAETLAAPPARLLEVDGIGESVVQDLKVVEAAARRIAKGAVRNRPVLSSWSAVLDYCRTAMAFPLCRWRSMSPPPSAAISATVRALDSAPGRWSAPNRPMISTLYGARFGVGTTRT